MPMSALDGDVRFDQAAAVAAIAACDRAEASLAEATRRFEVARIAAVDGWVGPHRRRFDEGTTRLAAVVADAHGAIGLARRRIVEGADAARREQHARDLARDAERAAQQRLTMQGPA